MNRRSFISTLLAGCVAPLILPGAGRTWKKSESLYVPNPAWKDAEYECILFGNDGKVYNFGPPPSNIPNVWFNSKAKRWYQKDSTGVFVPMDNVIQA